MPYDDIIWLSTRLEAQPGPYCLPKLAAALHGLSYGLSHHFDLRILKWRSEGLNQGFSTCQICTLPTEGHSFYLSFSRRRSVPFSCRPAMHGGQYGLPSFLMRLSAKGKVCSSLGCQVDQVVIMFPSFLLLVAPFPRPLPTPGLIPKVLPLATPHSLCNLGIKVTDPEAVSILKGSLRQDGRILQAQALCGRHCGRHPHLRRRKIRNKDRWVL